MSCGNAAKLSNQDYQRDSVVYVTKTEYRDTTIYIQVESQKESAVLPDTDTSRLATRYAESEAYVSDGKLHHTLRNKSEAVIPIEIKAPIVFEFESRINERIVKEEVEVEKELSKWQHFVMALGYAVLGAIVVWIAIKIKTLIA